jgi:hypothetical protein
MMRGQMNVYSFSLENLECRNFLSVAAPLAPAPIAQDTTVTERALTASHPLTGPFNAAGTYAQLPGNPDTGPERQFEGAGRSARLGRFTLTGILHSPGFINNARSHGRFTITTGTGP